MSEPVPMVEARGVCKIYAGGTPREVRALEDASLVVTRGSFTVLTGPSGSGKTTLLSLLGGLDRPTRGEVLFDGRPLAACSDSELTRIRRRAGFVFQEAGLLSGLSAGENVTYPLIPRGVRRAARLVLADEWLTRFGLRARATARASDLSGGESRRVALARAMAGSPEVIIADEPTASLDPEASQIVLTALTEALRSGVTVIASSHDPGVIRLATWVVELSAGRVADFPPAASSGTG